MKSERLSAIATARQKGLPLITADQEIIDSKLVESGSGFFPKEISEIEALVKR